MLLVACLNLAAWAAYVRPLGRLYALSDGIDRSFNVGMAACTAAGNSPFEHTTYGLGSPEPLWNALIAGLAGFRPEAVTTVFHWLAPASLALFAAAVYGGLRSGPAAEDRWERVLTVFAALDLSSLSMSGRAPVAPFWTANFLVKPNHGIGWGLIAFTAGVWARSAHPLPLTVALSALAWVALPAWALTLAGLAVGWVLQPRGERRTRVLLTAAVVSAFVALPYVLHLARDYAPLGANRSARHMWNDPTGLAIALPEWATIDLGPLLTLGALGAWCWARRRTARDHALLGLLLVAWAAWLVSLPAAVFGIAPEPDDLHYFLRFTMALAAGAGLAALARRAETVAGLRAGQGHALALAACIPFSFFAHWDPPTMDRYYALSLPPIPDKVLEYGRWVRDNTPPAAIFVAGRASGTWIPALAGRRLLLGPGKLQPRDAAERKQAERVLLTSEDAAAVRDAARRFGVGYVAVDSSLVEEYAADSFEALARSPAWRTVLANARVRIAALR
ncbi:MAG TPA: hypothetical protein VGQ78_10145 [Vicinamibacteria bacterium]|nr:hypothetical protein [Vicinamibacteria bacterium]